MAEKVTISYRGAGYEIGKGSHFYGIWAAGAPRSQPLEWWPETAAGWSAAWARFTAVETPGAIVGVGWRRLLGGVPGRNPAAAMSKGVVVAAALLAAGVVLGIAGLFPGYVGGQSLASEPAELAAHLIYLAAWAAGAVLVVRGGALLQAGALAATGTSIVTLGLFVADLGEKFAGNPASAGLWLSLVGWLACAAGAGLGLRLAAAGAPARPQRHEAGPVALVVIAGVGVALAYAPSWDSYVLRTAAGLSQTVTAGNAFAQPGAVIAGNVITMVAIAAAVAAAALWRPVRGGALLLAGVTIPLLAQAIVALVQLSQATSPSLFGIPPAEAASLGLSISNGLTAVFWVYCVFVVALAASCAWMFLAPDPAPAPAFAPPYHPGPAVPPLPVFPPAPPAGAPFPPAPPSGAAVPAYTPAAAAPPAGYPAPAAPPGYLSPNAPAAAAPSWSPTTSSMVMSVPAPPAPAAPQPPAQAVPQSSVPAPAAPAPAALTQQVTPEAPDAAGAAEPAPPAAEPDGTRESPGE